MEVASDAPQAAVETVASEAPAFEATPRGSIDRAFEAIDKAEAPVEASEPSERPRTPDGKFAAKETPAEAAPAPEAAPVADKPVTPASDAPARFSPEAKAAWATAPEPVKAEISRAIKELEGGIEKYRAEAEPLKPYAEMAKQSGTTLEAALARFVEMEGLLRKDLNEGVRTILAQAGLTPQQYAAHITGQPVEQADMRVHAENQTLRGEVERLRSENQQLKGDFESRERSAAQAEIDAFAKDRPRFEDLRPVMGKFIEQGFAHDLASAYEMAERLKPAPAPSQPQPAAPDLTAQTRKGSLSVTGAPSAGSTPANRTPPKSARESLDRAFASLGLPS